MHIRAKATDLLVAQIRGLVPFLSPRKRQHLILSLSVDRGHHLRRRLPQGDMIETIE
jgi:hypothetical protein